MRPPRHGCRRRRGSVVCLCGGVAAEVRVGLTLGLPRPPIRSGRWSLCRPAHASEPLPRLTVPILSSRGPSLAEIFESVAAVPADLCIKHFVTRGYGGTNPEFLTKHSHKRGVPRIRHAFARFEQGLGLRILPGALCHPVTLLQTQIFSKTGRRSRHLGTRCGAGTYMGGSGRAKRLSCMFGDPAQKPATRPVRLKP